MLADAVARRAVARGARAIAAARGCHVSNGGASARVEVCVAAEGWMVEPFASVVPFAAGQVLPTVAGVPGSLVPFAAPCAGQVVLFAAEAGSQVGKPYAAQGVAGAVVPFAALCTGQGVSCAAEAALGS